MQSLGAQLSALEWLDARTKAASKDLAADDATIFCAVLDDIKNESQSYLEAADHLCRRTQSIAQSVSDTLNLTQSNSTLVLANLARRDSVAIKALTLVTAIYLPFSFVAVCQWHGSVIMCADWTTDDLRHELRCFRRRFA